MRPPVLLIPMDEPRRPGAVRRHDRVSTVALALGRDGDAALGPHDRHELRIHAIGMRKAGGCAPIVPGTNETETGETEVDVLVGSAQRQ